MFRTHCTNRVCVANARWLEACEGVCLVKDDELFVGLGMSVITFRSRLLNDGGAVLLESVGQLRSSDYPSSMKTLNTTRWRQVQCGRSMLSRDVALPPADTTGRTAYRRIAHKFCQRLGRDRAAAVCHYESSWSPLQGSTTLLGRSPVIESDDREAHYCCYFFGIQHAQSR